MYLKYLSLAFLASTTFAQNEIEIDPNTPPCNGQNPTDVKVTRTPIENGEKTVTHLTCPDGTTETRTETRVDDGGWKIEYIDIGEFSIGVDKEDFLLESTSASRNMEKKGYVLLTTDMITKGVWGYFSYYYLKYGGVYSHGFKTKSDAICIDKFIQMHLIHAEVKEGILEIAQEWQKKKRPGDSFYQLCGGNSDGGQTCYGSNDAVNFRNFNSLFVDASKSNCQKAIGIYVRVDFLRTTKEWEDVWDPNWDPEHCSEPPCPGPGNGRPQTCYNHLGDPEDCSSQIKPVVALIGGVIVRMNAFTFVLADDDIVDKKKYSLVTPEMMQNGFWVYFKQFYDRFQGIIEYDNYVENTGGEICLGEGYRLHNFLKKEATTAFAKVEQFAKDGPGNLRQQLCYNDQCYTDVESFREKLDFSLAEGSCGGKYNLYVLYRLRVAILKTWKANMKTTIEVVKTGPPPTFAPPTTIAPPTEPPTEPATTQVPVTTPSGPHCMEDDMCQEMAFYEQEVMDQLRIAQQEFDDLQQDVQNLASFVTTFKRQAADRLTRFVDNLDIQECDVSQLPSAEEFSKSLLERIEEPGVAVVNRIYALSEVQESCCPAV